jgi:Glyoxalase/Bleomycin resistance protein/Dioxygenase superfamily
VKPFFQAGSLVQDLDAAMVELSDMLDVHWGKPLTREVGESELRVVFSLDGPPHIELTRGPAGSPWDASDGPRLDHLGYWSDDLEADKRRLDAQDVTLEADGAQLGGVPFAYLRGAVCGSK